MDCRGGSIALLSAPTLAYGSMLGFAQCHFTAFRPGQAAAAKPSTPQYMLNWEVDNAMLLVEDSFLEQPCSVRTVPACLLACLCVTLVPSALHSACPRVHNVPWVPAVLCETVLGVAQHIAIDVSCTALYNCF